MTSDSNAAPIAETSSSKDEGGIQVIARAGNILRALADHPGGMGLGPLSRHVALPRSTVQRIVAALELERFVESGGPDGVRLGSGLAALAVNIQSSFGDAVKPLMADLSNTLGETVVLGRMRRREIITVDQVIAERDLTVRTRIHNTFPLSCTAGGKALLAEMTDDAVTHLIGPDLPRPTASSPPDLPALLADLAEVRRTGLAYDHETNGVGICAVAVALPSQDAHDWTHAVSVVVPTARFTKHEVVRMENALRVFRKAVVDTLQKQAIQG